MDAAPSSTPSLTPSITRRVWLALGVIMLVGLGLRLCELGRQSTWADELYRVIWAKGYQFDRFYDVLPSETGARLPPASFRQSFQVVSVHNPPLNALFLNGWIKLTGSETDFNARLPAALFGVLSILAAFLAASRALGWKVGLWAAALVACSPFHVFYAQEASHYTPTAAFVAFSLYFYFGWLERPSWRDGAGLAVFGCAALYCHYYAGIALAFQGLEILLRHWRTPKTFAIASLPYAAIAVGFAPYLPTVRGQLGEMTSPDLIGHFLGGGYFLERLQALGVVPWFGERDVAFSPWFAVPLALATVALFVAGLRKVDDRGLRRALLVNGAGPVLAVIVMFWTMKTNSVLWSRYQLFFTFAQVIPFAVALVAFKWVRLVGAPVMAVLAALGLKFIYTDLLKEDWKHAAAFVDQSPNDEAVLVYLPNMTWAMARYLETPHRLFGVDDGPDLNPMLIKAVEGKPGAWFVSAWAKGPALPNTVHTYLGCHFAKREDFPVSAGRVGMSLTRYWERRPCDEPPAEGAASP